MVCPDAVSRAGVVTSRDEVLMNALAEKLYERLQTAPSFLCALVGIEVDEFRHLSEMDSDLVELDFAGSVIHRDLWHQLDRPEIFVPFAAGYLWRPFVGVT